jgi:hypothetical protein
MRFTALVASSLGAVAVVSSSTTTTTTQNNLKKQDKDRPEIIKRSVHSLRHSKRSKNRQQHIPFLNRRATDRAAGSDGRRPHHKTAVEQQEQKWRTSSSSAGRLQNNGKQKNEIQRMECAISSSSSVSDEDHEPDIGILLSASSCPPHLVCQESPDSSRGGLCDYPDDPDDNNRHLEESSFNVCNSSPGGDGVNDEEDFYSYYYESCDCSNFDSTLQQGSFICTIYGEEHCFDDTTNNGYDGYGDENEDGGTTSSAAAICGSLTVQRTLDDLGYETSEYCYSLTTPMESTVCYTYYTAGMMILDDNNDEDEDDAYGDCSITVNGVECQSCQIPLKGIPDPKYGFLSYGCFDFDCTNTLAGVKGVDCLGTFVLNGLFPGLLPTFAPTAVPSSSSTTGPPPSSSPTFPPPSLAPTVKPPSIPPTTLAIETGNEDTGSPSIIESSQAPTTTVAPSRSTVPSSNPTTITPGPSSLPSVGPSASLQPSVVPTTAPTVSLSPSWNPSTNPSVSLTPTTSSPTDLPSVSPSVGTTTPTFPPSLRPSVKPSVVEESSAVPTLSPTITATMGETMAPIASRQDDSTTDGEAITTSTIGPTSTSNPPSRLPTTVPTSTSSDAPEEEGTPPPKSSSNHRHSLLMLVVLATTTSTLLLFV